MNSLPGPACFFLNCGTLGEPLDLWPLGLLCVEMGITLVAALPGCWKPTQLLCELQGGAWGCKGECLSAADLEETAAMARPESSGCEICWDVPGGVIRQ